MLAFSGLGALYSTRIRMAGPRTMVILLAVLLGLIILELIVTHLLLDQLLALPMGGRVAMTLLLLFPLAFVLGIPFPLGLRYLERNAKSLIPWGWAVNGFLSVLASMLVPLVAMKGGFTFVIVIAGFVYTIGILLGPWNAKPERPSQVS
jgi:hypothetical protein